jgi:Xaa-Pro aminopeptidase
VSITSGAHIFVDAAKISPEIHEKFRSENVHVHAYDQIESFLVELSAQGNILADPSQLNWRLYRALNATVVSGVSPIPLMKAIKNDCELNGLRQAHIRDGVALTAFLHFLETTVKENPDSLTEYDVAEIIETYRHQMDMHLYPSFRFVVHNFHMLVN